MDDFLAFFSRQDVKEFIQQNLKSNVQKLLLNPPKPFREEIKQIAEQILSRQKIRKKLPDWYDDLDVIMPPPVSAEQSSSFATCQYKASLIENYNSSFTDLTGGMGVDCLYLSEPFRDVTYVEANTRLCEAFRHNSTHFQRDIRVVNSTAEEFLKTQKFQGKQLFYLDPDRRPDTKNRVFRMEDCRPHLHQILPMLEGVDFRMLVKLSPLLDMSVILEALPNASALHVISVRNECKEILVDLSPGASQEPRIHCANLEANQPEFFFSFSEEKSCNSAFGTTGEFIYEPNASIMKAGAFNSVGVRYGLKKLGRNTHLYTSNKLLQDFPGRVYKMLDHVNKNSLKQYAPAGKINVLVRNHPLSAQQIKSKWKLKDGGDCFVLGFQTDLKKAEMVIGQKLD